MRSLAFFPAFAVCAFISTPAAAVYKCESNGKFSYSDLPCATGKESSLSWAKPTEENMEQAQRQAQKERNEAQRLENARLKEERASNTLRIKLAKAHAARQKKCQSLALRLKWSEEEAAAATGRAGERARRKARQKSEQYALECSK